MKKPSSTFIATATGPAYAIRGSVYEFAYPPVLDALAAAATRGVDVKIIYDRRGRASTDPSRTKVWEVSEPAIAAAGLTPHMIPRRTNSAISHNKFLILLKNDTAQSVWTGSTNLTWGGLFGQSNVGHLLREPAIADSYLQLWNRLATDPGYADIRPANTSHTATPASPPATGISPIFSPRTSLDMIDWYAHQAGNANKIVLHDRGLRTPREDRQRDRARVECPALPRARETSRHRRRLRHRP